MSVLIKDFGTTKSRLETKLYVLKNANGTEASFTDLGAAWVTMKVRDKKGDFSDVVLGYDDPETYFSNPTSCGECVGRNANRIGGAAFTLSGKTYRLAKNNNGLNNLHSGPDKWFSHMFEGRTAGAEEGSSVTFTLFSPDGSQGFPGNMNFSVTYTLTENDELIIRYEADTDADTIINPTNHAYFNLAGHNSGSIEGHKVWINADAYTPADKYSIPTGEIAPTAGTPMDFTAPKTIGQDIDSEFDQLQYAGGYDHNWVLNDYNGKVRLAARAEDPVSGRIMECLTDLPGMQFYTGNMLKNLGSKKDGADYLPRYGFCFETQYFPDAINKSDWPKPIVKAGEKYRSTTIYRFM